MAERRPPYAPEYRHQMVELVRAGRTPGELAREFECSAQAKREVFDFVEGWYNPGRRHSALGYLSPNDFERAAAGAQPAFAPCPKTRPEAPNHPPQGLPTPVHKETSTLSALAHHHTPGERKESHQPSTRSG